MLSAFKAQSIYELKSRDKSKIESLLAYGDRLLVGLNNGALRIFRINENPGPTETTDHGDNSQNSSKAKAVELLWEEEKFSKRPVQQLAVVKEANLLISLSETYVCLYDLQSYGFVERIERTKGATCFAVSSNVIKDLESNVPSLVSRLAVAVKRKILCWTWQDMEQLPDVVEISLEATIKSLNWVTGTRLVVGMDPGFSLVDVSNQEITAIYKQNQRSSIDAGSGELAGVRFGAVSSSGMGYMGMSGWVPKPMATGLSEDLIILAKDVNTMFTDADGKALEKRQVPWSLAPEAVGYSYPYLLALQPPDKGTLQTRNPDTLSLLQTIDLPGATVLHVPQPNISLAHAGKGFLVASERGIWRMNALPYQSQLTELLEAQHFDEAISLLKLLEDTLLEDKPGRIREVMILKAIALFNAQKYRPALDLLTDAEAPPERVISLYPRVVAGSLSNIPEESDQSVPIRTSLDSAGRKSTDSNQEAPSTPTKSMFGRFLGTPKRNDPETASIKSPSRGETDSPSNRSKQNPKATDYQLDGENLKSAVDSLCSFLAQTRKQIQKHLNPNGTLKQDPPVMDTETGKPLFANVLSPSVFEKNPRHVDWQKKLLKTAQLVDTTLFRSYMLVRPSLAGPLFRLDNFCDPDTVQSSLYENHRYNDLIDFLHGKALHRQALEMLTKFGIGQADGEIPEGMPGPARTVAYLKQLPPELIDLILEYIRWPIEEKPQVAMEVFLADTDNAENLPRLKVVEFLSGTQKSLEMQYIEHIIDELDERDGGLHQRLVDMYLVHLKDNKTSEETRSELKLKLESFLRKSKTYNKSQTFRQLPADGPTFYEARALVLSAMGNHKQALSIYVFKIQDYLKAEDYCNRVYLENLADQQPNIRQDGRTTPNNLSQQEKSDGTAAESNIFAILLGLYLRPPVDEEKRWPQALDLLSKHGPRLPTSSTLDLMPDELAVKELQDYFRGRIRNATSVMREEAIVRSLEGVRRATAERNLLLGPDTSSSEQPLGRNRRVKIEEDDHCKVCHKRFGTSAIRVYPNNEVVHYGCVGNRKRTAAPGLGPLRRSSGRE